jgi:uncharacterized membrane protein YccF (DUF307 family)
MNNAHERISGVPVWRTLTYHFDGPIGQVSVHRLPVAGAKWMRKEPSLAPYGTEK